MSYLLQFGVVFAMVVFGCSKVTLQSFVSRGYVRNTSDSVLFNAQLFVFIAVVMSVLFPLGKLSWEGLFMAFFMGLFTVIFQTFYALALKSGPVSITVLIGNFALFFVTGFSVIAYRESVYLTQIFGIALLILAMFLSVKKDANEKGISAKWIVYVALMTASNAVSSIVMKIFAMEMSAAVENSQNTFMVASYAIAAVLAFFSYFIGAHTGRREGNTYGFFNRHVLLYAFAIGVVLSIYQKFYLLGLEKIDGGFLFPTYSGMQSLGMTAIGIFLFKDKLSKRQIFGVVCGISCVVLMNLRFMKLF